MNKKVWIVLTVLLAVALAVAAIAAIAMGPCTGMLELANGNSVSMKCHWTYRAVAALAIAGIVLALCMLPLGTKEGRRIAAVASALNAILVGLFPLYIIGTCMSVDMQCNATKPLVLVCVGIALVIAIVQFVKADPEAASKPKAQL